MLAGSLLACFACAPDGGQGDFRLLVFPAEAMLGGSAAAVISSNYIPDADAAELYDLKKSRVSVSVKDGGGIPRAATVRSVFPLAASASSQLAATHPGAWATVVLFDLPTANFAFTPPFLDTEVIVSIDSVAQDDLSAAVGTIRITGVSSANGGKSTTILWPPLSNLELEPLMLRVRPVLSSDPPDEPGFPEGAVVAGIEADLVYLWPCLENFRASTGTEAIDANVHIGPLTLLNGFMFNGRIVITFPEGFTLSAPSNDFFINQPWAPEIDPTRLGEGPFLDISFHRPNQSAVNCSGVPLVFHNVYAVGPDGETLVDERSLALGPGESSPSLALVAIAP